MSELAANPRPGEWRFRETFYWFRFFLWWLSSREIDGGYTSEECLKNAAQNHQFALEDMSP